MAALNFGEADLSCELRVVGYSQPSIRISTDEGDGIEMTLTGEGVEPEAKHYKNWANQLELIAWKLKKKALELRSR